MKLIIKLVISSILLITINSQCDTVLKIEPENFKTQTFPIMINYQAPWCQQCLDFDIVYEQLAKKVDIFLGTFDCSIHLEHCQRIGINKFPTLIYHFDEKYHIQYKDGKNQQEVISFLDGIKNLYKMSALSINDFLNSEIKNLKKFTIYYQSTNNKIQNKIKHSSVILNQRNQEEFQFVYSENNSNESLYLINNQLQQHLIIPIQEDNNIVDIIEKESYSGLQQYSLKFDKWAFEDQGQAILIIFTRQQINQNDMKQLNELALKFKGIATITYLIEGKWNGTLIKLQERYGPIEKNQEIVFFGINKFKKYKNVKPQNIDLVLEVELYLGLMLTNKLNVYYKSELAFSDQENKKEQFNSISGSQLIEKIDDNINIPFIVIFYSKYCPMCSRAFKMVENFQKTNIKNKKNNDDQQIIDIFKIDGQQNEIPNIEIINFPTIFIWKNGKYEEIINQNFDSRDFYKTVYPYINQKNTEEL